LFDVWIQLGVIYETEADKPIIKKRIIRLSQLAGAYETALGDVFIQLYNDDGFYTNASIDEVYDAVKDAYK